MESLLLQHAGQLNLCFEVCNWASLNTTIYSFARTAMEFDDSTTLICVGKFDANGMPLILSRHLSQQATVTFQAISLEQVLREVLGQEEGIQGLSINHRDGSSIRIDRNSEGFIAYLEPSGSRLESH
jgi:hypothetical protein